MSDKVLLSISKCLESKKIENIKTFFVKFDIEKLTEINSLYLLNNILIYCEKFKTNKPIIQYILNMWIEKFNFVEIFGLIFSKDFFDPIGLKYLLKEFSEITTLKVIQNLLYKNLYENKIIYIFENLEKNSEIKITRGEVLSLLEISMENENITSDYFKSILNDTEEFSEYPEWCSVLKDEENLDIKYLDPDNWSTENIDIREEMEEEIVNKINKDNQLSSSTNLKEVVNIALSTCDLFQELEIDDKCLFANRIFGPRNAILGEECISGIKGGCRMLSCKCFSENLDWFDFSCDGCMLRIKNMSHCIRYPLEGGGWSQEIYCGIECMSKNPPNIDKNTDIRLDRLVENIEEYGIYDRNI